MKSRQIKGALEIALGSLGFGFLGIFGKWAFQSGLSVGELLSYRFIAAAALLWLGLLFFARKKIYLPLNQILISCALGVFGYAVFATLYFVAIKGVSVGLAALLLYTYPFWVSLFGHILMGEKMSRIQWLLLFGAFAGVTCLLWGQFHVSNAGALVAGLGSAVTYAAYILISGKLQRNVQPISSSLYVITSAAIALTLYHQPSLHFTGFLSLSQWKIVLGIASVSTIFPMTLILAGLQKMKSAQAALISMCEPVTATVAAGVILQEQMTSLQVAGATLVLTCLVFSILQKA